MTFNLKYNFQLESFTQQLIPFPFSLPFSLSNIPVAILQHWTFTKQFPPSASTGELKLIIICKTVIHSQQWAFTSKSSVRDAHKNRAFFS